MPNEKQIIVGTVRNTKKMEDLIQKYPEIFDCEILDVPAVQKTVKDAWWYTMAPAVLSFLSEHDWKGKTIIPF